MISYHLKHPIFSTLNNTPRNHDLIRYLHIFACHLDSFRGCLMLGGWEYLHTLWQAQAFIDTDMCNIFTCMFSNIYIYDIYIYIIWCIFGMSWYHNPIPASPGFYVIIDDFSFNLVTTSDLCVAEQAGHHSRDVPNIAGVWVLVLLMCFVHA